LTNYFHEDEEDLEEEEEELCQQSRSTKINSHNGEVYTIEDSDDDTETDSDDFDEEDIPEFKMVFVVNMSLEMGPGKIAAQVGHAALGVQRVLSSKAKSGKYKLSTTDLGLWQDFGENMVVVQGESTQHLKDLHLMAEDLELPSFLIKDAGITQVPSGAVTVFGVFGEDEDVNKITGRLKHL
jgi:peptidyl-tRNA hydrolase